MPKLFSSRNRAPHFGPYPLERLPRSDSAPSTEGLAEIPPLRLPEPENPYSIANSFPRFFELYRRLRNGEVREQAASIPSDPEERLRHLKSLSYFLDASQVGACLIPEDARLGRTVGVKFDVVSDSDSGDQEYMYTPSKNGSADGDSATDCSGHDYALAILVEYSRDPSARDPLAGEMHTSQAPVPRPVRRRSPSSLPCTCGAWVGRLAHIRRTPAISIPDPSCSMPALRKSGISMAASA